MDGDGWLGGGLKAGDVLNGERGKGDAGICLIY